MATSRGFEIFLKELVEPVAFRLEIGTSIEGKRERERGREGGREGGRERERRSLYLIIFVKKSEIFWIRFTWRTFVRPWGTRIIQDIRNSYNSSLTSIKQYGRLIRGIVNYIALISRETDDAPLERHWLRVFFYNVKLLPLRQSIHRLECRSISAVTSLDAALFSEGKGDPEKSRERSNWSSTAF